MRWWPRTIRKQMLAGLVLIEAFSIGLFALLLIHQQTRQINLHARQRLAREATTIAFQSSAALQQQQRLDWISLSLRLMSNAPNVAIAKVTDPVGHVLFVSKGDPQQAPLDDAERAQIPLSTQDQARIFTLGKERMESVRPIYSGGALRGFAWIQENNAADRQQLNAILQATTLFGIIWIASSALLVLLLSRSISLPLATLHRGTRALMKSPESGGEFPLPVHAQNEIGDLIEAFNRMVAAIKEQRAGLNDTLSLLDSMLANAPIGLAFVDHNCRLVRVNQVFAEMTGIPLDHHLGRTLSELLPPPVSDELEKIILRVFVEEQPVRSLEISGSSGQPPHPWTWLASAYPVRTDPLCVQWAGVIVLDASERKRSEEALRKSEKLAATGRLAASIAHEINNPLEGITNLLFLLRNYCQLQDPALNYVTMAEHEAHRIAEITQQTLRFYRQSTLPAHTSLGDLLDSTLGIYHGRIGALGIQVEKKYDPSLELFCLAGEIRQVVANLIGNALDASSSGGRLIVRARLTRNAKHPSQSGVRFTIADTGAGMEPAVRARALEAFFTTKETTGTGLGLWISQEIVLKHNGLLRLRSRTARSGKASGTVFQVFLPSDSPFPSAPLSAVENQPA